MYVCSGLGVRVVWKRRAAETGAPPVPAETQHKDMLL